MTYVLYIQSSVLLYYKLIINLTNHLKSNQIFLFFHSAISLVCALSYPSGFASLSSAFRIKLYTMEAHTPPKIGPNQ